MHTQLAELGRLVRAVLCNPDIELEESIRFEDLPACGSMHLISVVVETERRFNVTFEANEVEALSTVGQLLRLIARKRALARA